MADKVLIIGSGSREHALAWKISQSEEVGEIYVSPGNAGTLCVHKCTNVDLNLNDFGSVANWCKDHSINLTVIGPEVYLADGLSDILNSYGLKCFGPSKHAAQIESSKFFSKQFMDRYRIPTACWKSFTNTDDATDYINKSGTSGFVVKASGLASGKGVFVTSDKEEAVRAVIDIMKIKKFGEAGNTVIIEEKLEGEEISVFAFSDGEHTAVFPPAQDYKRAYDNDQGPNTGGMGAYCPVSHVSDEVLKYIRTNIIQTTVDGLKKDGYPFVGLLYAGLMLTQNGPKILEFNCRFGDPETQVVLPLLSSDLYVIMKSCCAGYLQNTPVTFYKEKTALTVVLASGGYPEQYKKGMAISDLKDIEAGIHVATCLNLYRIVYQLILKEVKIDLVDVSGKNLFHICAEQGHVESLRAIVDAIRRTGKCQMMMQLLHEPDNDGYTPFYIAVSQKKDRICSILASFNINVNTMDRKCGNSPLHEAILSLEADREFVEFLIKDCKLNVNHQSYIGITPLHIASSKNDKPMCSALLYHNADLNIRDIQGLTPVDYTSDSDLQKHLLL